MTRSQERFATQRPSTRSADKCAADRVGPLTGPHLLERPAVPIRTSGGGDYWVGLSNGRIHNVRAEAIGNSGVVVSCNLGVQMLISLVDAARLIHAVTLAREAALYGEDSFAGCQLWCLLRRQSRT